MNTPDASATTTDNGKGRSIRVEQAAIHTATISVRALTIDRRQVTLTVFRQLRDARLVDEQTGEFNGLPWGTVNYCPPRECQSDEDEHLHVVWQQGDELRRAREFPPADEFRPRAHRLAAAWLVLALEEGWRPPAWEEYGYRDGHAHYWCSVQFADDLPPVAAEIRAGVGLRTAIGARSHRPYQEQQDAAAAEKGAAELAERAREVRGRGDFTADQLAETTARLIREQRVAWERHHDRWGELESLPQLFIAT